MKRTTVVIPNYNGKIFIRECLSSLLRQTEEEYEIIVVDNGSTDESLVILKEEFPKIKTILLNENTGFSHAVNVGIKEANSKYVLLLNNDTVVDKNFVKVLSDTIEKDQKIFSVSARMVDMKNQNVLDGAGDLYCALGWAFARGKGKSTNAFENQARIFSACAGAAIYRKEILDKIGAFDEEHFAYLEDLDLGYRAGIYGYKNMYQPNAIVFHAGSAVSGSRHNAFKVNLSARNNVYLLYKNMPLLQYLINLPFLLLGFLVKWMFFVSKKLGWTYVRGTARGVKLSFSKKGRKHKVAFQAKHLKNYVWIQLQLWKNMFLRLK